MDGEVIGIWEGGRGMGFSKMEGGRGVKGDRIELDGLWGRAV